MMHQETGTIEPQFRYNIFNDRNIYKQYYHDNITILT